MRTRNGLTRVSPMRYVAPLAVVELALPLSDRTVR